MNGILEKLTPIVRGMSLRKVLTAERIGAIQDAIHALAAGENLVMGPGLARGWGRGSARLDLKQRKPTRRAAAEKKPLQIVASRPAYIPEPASAPATGDKRFYLTWGTVNGVVADNWDDHFDFSPTPDGGRFFFAKATFAASDSLKVASWEILTGTTDDAYQTPEWEAGGARPAYYVFSLGSVYVYTPEATEENPSPAPAWSILPTPGSVMITEHVTNIGGTGTAGEFILTKQLSHYLI
jgi:hypothetical protein